MNPDIEQYRIAREPFYRPQGDEVVLHEAAYAARLPVMLKGPTGCGKTRFVEAMAHDLGRPLITVSCHDDLTTADLVGRYLLRGGDTEWVDGPLTRAVREGAICYLDEVVEARQDTTVVLHPLADRRRQLPIEKLGETLTATKGFCLVVSYNPGYQSVLKDLKDSTRQRMVAIEFDYPAEDIEVGIVMAESGSDERRAGDLVRLAQAIRRLDVPGIREVSSTRVLIAAARLAQAGLPLIEAAEADDQHRLGFQPHLPLFPYLGQHQLPAVAQILFVTKRRLVRAHVPPPAPPWRSEPDPLPPLPSAIGPWPPASRRSL